MTALDEVADLAEMDCATSEALGGKICAAAGLAAQADAQLIELIGEFDAGNAVRWWQGVTSLAHWLCWACSMSPGTAREHIRVARALPRMPVVRAAFAEGRLSYSKVREVTRVVDTVGDAQLCELALQATAAQLAKTISGYRTAAGQRLRQERERRLTWTERESGTVDLRLRLPKEEAAVFLAALTAAKDQYGTPPAAVDDGGQADGQSVSSATGSASDSAEAPERKGPPATQTDTTQTDTTPTYTLADAALDVARVFLATAPEDRSGEDRTLVVVHVAADQLAGDAARDDSHDQAAQDVPAGRSTAAADPNPAHPAEREPVDAVPESRVEPESCFESEPESRVEPESGLEPEPEIAQTSGPATEEVPNDPSDVPAGTSAISSVTPTPTPTPTCQVQGLGGIEPETARKLACDADVLGAILDAHGDVLALGRTRRLVSRAQRRALMIRDQGRCQFTGCHQTQHLKAHHVIHWFDGGPTDLDNLMLLCQFHHTAVHEGQMIIRRIDPEVGCGAVRRWDFLMPDGTAHRDWWSAEGLLSFLSQHADRRQTELQRRRRETMIDNVRSFHHPDAQRIQPGWRGERYDRHEAVQALFRMPVQDPIAEAA